jgi:hypothetical protein
LVLLALVATSVALFAMLLPLYGAIIVVAALFILPGSKRVGGAGFIWFL